MLIPMNLEPGVEMTEFINSLAIRRSVVSADVSPG